MPLLVPVGEHAGKPPLPLKTAVTVIGSGKFLRVQLRSDTISTQHVLIVQTPAGTYFRDLASRTHTILNGKVVRESPLRTGDTLTLGAFVFRYEDAPDFTPRPVQPPPPAAIDANVEFPLPLDARTAVIGRRRGCDILIDDPSVSTAHAVIYELDGKHFLLDLHSRTGTFVNGEPARDIALNFDDEIRVGDTVLRYISARAAGVEVVSPATLTGAAVVLDDEYIEEPSEERLPIVDDENESVNDASPIEPTRGDLVDLTPEDLLDDSSGAEPGDNPPPPPDDSPEPAPDDQADGLADESLSPEDVAADAEPAETIATADDSTLEESNQGEPADESTETKDVPEESTDLNHEAPSPAETLSPAHANGRLLAADAEADSPALEHVGVFQSEIRTTVMEDAVNERPSRRPADATDTSHADVAAGGPAPIESAGERPDLLESAIYLSSPEPVLSEAARRARAIAALLEETEAIEEEAEREAAAIATSVDEVEAVVGSVVPHPLPVEPVIAEVPPEIEDDPASDISVEPADEAESIPALEPGPIAFQEPEPLPELPPIETPEPISFEPAPQRRRVIEEELHLDPPEAIALPTPPPVIEPEESLPLEIDQPATNESSPRTDTAGPDPDEPEPPAPFVQADLTQRTPAGSGRQRPAPADVAPVIADIPAAPIDLNEAVLPLAFGLSANAEGTTQQATDKSRPESRESRTPEARSRKTNDVQTPSRKTAPISPKAEPAPAADRSPSTADDSPDAEIPVGWLANGCDDEPGEAVVPVESMRDAPAPASEVAPAVVVTTDTAPAPAPAESPVIKSELDSPVGVDLIESAVAPPALAPAPIDPVQPPEPIAEPSASPESAVATPIDELSFEPVSPEADALPAGSPLADRDTPADEPSFELDSTRANESKSEPVAEKPPQSSVEIAKPTLDTISGGVMAGSWSSDGFVSLSGGIGYIGLEHDAWERAPGPASAPAAATPPVRRRRRRPIDTPDESSPTAEPLPRVENRLPAEEKIEPPAADPSETTAQRLKPVQSESPENATPSITPPEEPAETTSSPITIEATPTSESAPRTIHADAPIANVPAVLDEPPLVSPLPDPRESAAANSDVFVSPLEPQREPATEFRRRPTEPTMSSQERSAARRALTVAVGGALAFGAWKAVHLFWPVPAVVSMAIRFNDADRMPPSARASFVASQLQQLRVLRESIAATLDQSVGPGFVGTTASFEVFTRSVEWNPADPNELLFAIDSDARTAEEDLQRLQTIAVMYESAYGVLRRETENDLPAGGVEALRQEVRSLEDRINSISSEIESTGLRATDRPEPQLIQQLQKAVTDARARRDAAVAARESAALAADPQLAQLSRSERERSAAIQKLEADLAANAPDRLRQQVDDALTAIAGEIASIRSDDQAVLDYLAEARALLARQRELTDAMIAAASTRPKFDDAQLQSLADELSRVSALRQHASEFDAPRLDANLTLIKNAMLARAEVLNIKLDPAVLDAANPVEASRSLLGRLEQAFFSRPTPDATLTQRLSEKADVLGVARDRLIESGPQPDRRQELAELKLELADLQTQIARRRAEIETGPNPRVNSSLLEDVNVAEAALATAELNLSRELDRLERSDEAVRKVDALRGERLERRRELFKARHQLDALEMQLASRWPSLAGPAVVSVRTDADHRPLIAGTFAGLIFAGSIAATFAKPHRDDDDSWMHVEDASIRGTR